MRATASRSHRKIAIPGREGFKLKNVSELVYCVSKGNGSLLFFHDGNKINSSKALNELESELSTIGFFRIHKSFLVNLEYVAEVSHNCKSSICLFDGTVLNISTRKKKSFMDQFTKV